MGGWPAVGSCLSGGWDRGWLRSSNGPPAKVSEGTHTYTHTHTHAWHIHIPALHSTGPHMAQSTAGRRSTQAHTMTGNRSEMRGVCGDMAEMVGLWCQSGSEQTPVLGECFARTCCMVDSRGCRLMGPCTLPTCSGSGICMLRWTNPSPTDELVMMIGWPRVLPPNDQ